MAEPPGALPPEAPPVGQKPDRSIALVGVAGNRDVTVNLYSSVGGEARGYLVDGDAIYGLGLVGGVGGAPGVETSATDITGDGRTEIAVSGDMGASARQLKVIGYNTSQNRWEELYSSGAARLLDLEGDGKPELVEESLGSLPPYVIIHRWAGDRFERLDIGSATGSQAVTLVVNGSDVRFELVRDGRGQQYRYLDGKLHEVTEPK